MLTELQQIAIIESVTAGATWLSASEKAGVPLETMVACVADGRRVDGCPACKAFVKRLKDAGAIATAKTLSYTRRVPHNA